jgi:hypothetical protein
MNPTTSQFGRRHLTALLAAVLLVAAFFLKGLAFESFVDINAYGFYYLFYFDEREIAFYLWFAALLLPAALFLARYLEGNFKGRILDRLLNSEDVSDRAFSLLILLYIFAISFSQAALTLEFTPVTDDERVYEMMANLLLEGRIRYPAPSADLLPFISKKFLNFDGQMTGTYLWGHPAFLIPGMLIGCPHLMNALGAGITAWCTFRIARLLFDRQTARLAGLLMMLSPLFTFGSATLLSHSSATMFLAIGALGYVQFIKASRWARTWAFISGAALAWAFYCRPASAAIDVFIGLHLVWTVIRTRGSCLKNSWPFAVGIALPTAAFGWIQYELGGSLFMPLITTFAKYRPGLGLNNMVGNIVYTPLLALSNLLDNLLKLNLWAFGWPISLVFAVLALWKGRPRLKVLALIGAALFHVGLMFFFWSSGVDDFGPSYYYPLIPILAILTACGILGTGKNSPAQAGNRVPPNISRIVGAFVVALCLVCSPIAWFLQASSLSELCSRIRAPDELLEAAGVDQNALIFMQRPSPPVSWVLGISITTPPYRDPLLFFQDRGRDADLAIARKFPNREAFRLVCRDTKQWILERLDTGEVVKVGPPVWGNRTFYPPRKFYPYSALWGKEHVRLTFPKR